MWIATSKQQLRQHLTHQPIVLVPTMGALHPGHIALIHQARQAAGPSGLVIVSIFVNPTQFNNPADLKTYPRPVEQDLAICQTHHVDGVFLPANDEMYTPDHSIVVLEKSLTQSLCGATRPGHFDGVCTVVLKLFLLTRCTAAVFGEKDYQQLAIIRRMVRDLDLETTILPCPTVRETDGLAMSSRNLRLSPAQRADAPRIYQAIQQAASLDDPSTIETHARQAITASPLAKIDYLTLVDAETLAPAKNRTRPTILACAVFYDDIRLIDNIPLPALASH